MEPLLLEELRADNVPRSFEKLENILQCGDAPADKHDCVVLFSHILMLESGFVAEGCEEFYNDKKIGFNYRRILSTVATVPKNWKRNEVLYVLCYVYPPFANNICEVTFIVTGDDLIVNARFREIENSNFTVLLDPSRYVISAAKNIENKFREMSHLSQIFKTAICNPARNVVLKLNNYSGFCLEDMPYEILLHIKKYLDWNAKRSFKNTCKCFRSLTPTVPYIVERRYNTSYQAYSYKPAQFQWKFCYRFMNPGCVVRFFH